MNLMADAVSPGWRAGRNSRGRSLESRGLRKLASGVLLLLAAPAAGQFHPVVEVEEEVTTYVPAGNGAGPLWCYGSTVIARQGDDVYLSTIETGKDVPPLCNTRWQLWHRAERGWKLVQAEPDYRQREPCPMAIFHDGRIFLSVNPSTQPPGTHYGPCHPLVLEFDPRHLAARPVAGEPAWAPDTRFTDHSYRGFAADGAGGELLLCHIHADTGAQFMSFRDRAGQWHARGQIEFPIRSCYPQLALRDRAAHIMAIGDIVEPVDEWRELKYTHLKSKWDYVFRRLFYSFTRDIMNRPFLPPIEIDTVDDTCGHISNLDLHIDDTGSAHLLYLKRPYQHVFIRDRYFPGRPMTAHLEYVVVRDGRVVSRRTLAETPGDGEGLEPGFGRFHVTADGTLCVIATGTEKGKSQLGTFVATVPRGSDPIVFTGIDLKYPFGSFMTAAPRAGSRCSDIIDVFGSRAGDALKLFYARIRLAAAPESKPETASGR